MATAQVRYTVTDTREEYESTTRSVREYTADGDKIKTLSIVSDALDGFIPSIRMLAKDCGQCWPAGDLILEHFSLAASLAAKLLSAVSV